MVRPATSGTESSVVDPHWFKCVNADPEFDDQILKNLQLKKHIFLC
jgi:hypothetical protein